MDGIIIGGEEPAEKPAKNIFAKALSMAGCEPHEAMHVEFIRLISKARRARKVRQSG